jgi:hypothetical protein
MLMLASSAASCPVERCHTSGSRCDAKSWKQCPASCTSVFTSSGTPTAFMKMNGRPRHDSLVQ